MTDPYKILGVSPNADDQEITKAYRELAKKYHPDLNPGDVNAAARMQEINEAYDAIKKGDTSGTQNPGGYGYNTYGSRRTLTPLDSAEAYLRSRMYEQALYVLQGIQEKSARWYYLSGIANSQAGNQVLAIEHAQMAVNIEPNNRVYQNMLENIKTGQTAFFQTRTIKPFTTMGKLLAAFILARLCCCLCR